MHNDNIYAHWKKTLLPLKSTIKDAVVSLGASGYKIILVIEGDKLVGTITDGDIRRGLLKGLDLNQEIESIIHRDAVVVPPNLDKSIALQIMKANKITQLPVVDEYHRILGLHLWNELETEDQNPIPNTFVIMAGGKGERLRPYTENCPKPMVPVAGKPMMEHIIERAKRNGFRNFLIATHYLGYMIEDYFKDGNAWDISIDYIREATPIGTAGALGLIKKQFEDPIVVTNGDVLTDINYNDVLRFHFRHGASGTMVVRSYEWQHPYGVVNMTGLEISGFEEKPIQKSHVNAGIYILSPEASQLIKPNEYLDMPTLFSRLKSDNRKIIAFPMHEPWIDVGRPVDLDVAQNIKLKD
jgi:dTDP-glucose pyrophosphorylase